MRNAYMATTAAICAFCAHICAAQVVSSDGTILNDDATSRTRVVVDAFANSSGRVDRLVRVIVGNAVSGTMSNTNWVVERQGDPDPEIRFVGRITANTLDARVGARVVSNEELAAAGFPTNEYGDVIEVDAGSIVEIAKSHSFGDLWTNLVTSFECGWEKLESHEEYEEYDTGEVDGDGNPIYGERVIIVTETNFVTVGRADVSIKEWLGNVMDEFSPTNMKPDTISFLADRSLYDIYVSDRYGDDSNWGTTPFTPLKTIGAAILLAQSNGLYSVSVYDGEYSIPQGYGLMGAADRNGNSLPRPMYFHSVNTGKARMTYEKTVQELGTSNVLLSIHGYDKNYRNMVWEGFELSGFRNTGYCYGNYADLFRGGYFIDCTFTGIAKRPNDTGVDYFSVRRGFMSGCVLEGCSFRDNRWRIDRNNSHGLTLIGCAFFGCSLERCKFTIGEDGIEAHGGGQYASFFYYCDFVDSQFVNVCTNVVLSEIFHNVYYNPGALIMNAVLINRPPLTSAGGDTIDVCTNILLAAGSGGNVNDYFSTPNNSTYCSFEAGMAKYETDGVSDWAVDAFGYGDAIGASVRKWVESLGFSQYGVVELPDDSVSNTFCKIFFDNGELKIASITDASASSQSPLPHGRLMLGVPLSDDDETPTTNVVGGVTFARRVEDED